MTQTAELQLENFTGSCAMLCAISHVHGSMHVNWLCMHCWPIRLVQWTPCNSALFRWCSAMEKVSNFKRPIFKLNSGQTQLCRLWSSPTYDNHVTYRMHVPADGEMSGLPPKAPNTKLLADWTHWLVASDTPFLMLTRWSLSRGFYKQFMEKDKKTHQTATQITWQGEKGEEIKRKRKDSSNMCAFAIKASSS